MDIMELQKTFVANMRAMLAERGINQSDLAQRLKVTPAYVSQLLSGHRTPHLETLEKLAKAMNCRASDLISEKVPT
jgi:transcriptional regulator with XRE-family HTH domain